MDEKKRNKKIAAKLREARKNAGFSTEEAADHLGFSQVSLSRMETGQSMLTVARLEKLAEYYKISLPDLLKEKLVAMPSSVDVVRMKAVVVLVHQVIAKLRVKPSPEKIAEVVTSVYSNEIERLVQNPKSDGEFDPAHHEEFVMMVFRK